MRNRTLSLILPVLLSVTAANAQFEHRTLGARSAALAGSSSLLIRDNWTGWINPAGLAFMTEPSASISVVPYRFGLEELRTTGASITTPIAGFTGGLFVQRYGFELYRETSIYLPAAVQFGDNFAAGGGVNWNHLAIEGYGSASTLTLTAGMYLMLASNLNAAVSVSNLNRGTIGRNRNPLPQILHAGLNYRPHPLLRVLLEVQKDVFYPPELRFALEYFLLDFFAVRAGVNDYPTLATGGFGITLGRFTFDYALQWHFELGQTHYLTLAFAMPRFNMKRDAVNYPEMYMEFPPTVFKTVLLQLPSPGIKGINEYTDEPDGLLNFLNSADALQLGMIPGIGHVIAERIIEYRTLVKGFNVVKDLLNVKGVGPVVLDSVKRYWEEIDEE